MCFKHFIFKATLSYPFPYLLNRIHFRHIWWDKNNFDIFREYNYIFIDTPHLLHCVELFESFGNDIGNVWYSQEISFLVLRPNLGIRLYSIEIYPLLEYPIKNKKSSNISVTAFHRFITKYIFKACIGSLLSAALLSCIFSLVKSLAIIAFILKSLYHIHCIKEFFAARINNCTD